MADTDTDLAALVDAVADVLEQTLVLVRGLTEEQGALATACPGWTVKDQLAHMVGLEQMLAGSPHPDIELPDLDHVDGDIDRYMEQQVHARRMLPLAAVADELAGLAPRRVAQLREQAAQGDPEVTGILGTTRPLSAGLPIRVFDLWVHEQDIRRAVGAPVRMEGVAADLAVARTRSAWASVLPDRVTADGTLRIEIEGEEPVVVVFGEGSSHLTLTTNRDAATRLGCGRATLEELAGAVGVHGDPDLAAAVGPQLAFTP